MKRAEILTLIGAGVDLHDIRTAIVAGKLEGIMRAAAREVYVASKTGEALEWTEILQRLEGCMRHETVIAEHKAEQAEYRRDHPRNTKEY